MDRGHRVDLCRATRNTNEMRFREVGEWGQAGGIAQRSDRNHDIRISDVKRNRQRHTTSCKRDGYIEDVISLETKKSLAKFPGWVSISLIL